MEAEHCTRGGFDFEFETSNYTGIKTHPKKEWDIVINKEACPAEELKFNRRIPDIEKLLELSLAKRATLQKSEVIAVVLYSGPMVIFLNFEGGFPSY
jgi:hypothetical protein